MVRRRLVFFFFFQAEDGIRDVAVTGVQTCALPICGGVRRGERPRGARPRRSPARARLGEARSRTVRARGPGAGARVRRSEEHTSELQSRLHLVCRLLLEKKKSELVRGHPIMPLPPA